MVNAAKIRLWPRTMIALAIIFGFIPLARGLKIDCGCGLFFQRQVGLESILEDALILGVAGWLYWRECQAGNREASLILVQSK